MDIQSEIVKAKDLIDKVTDILIVTHENPTEDSIGSALSLYLGLMSIGKKVTVTCPDQITVALSNYIGVNKMTTELGKKNFIISLDYTEGSIEKVSYNIEGDTFNLVIEPRPGYESFSAEKVRYSEGGASAELIICVDTIHLGGLKKIYETEKELYASKPIINIDRHSNNARYGQVNIVDGKASSTIEIVTQLLSTLGVRLTQDIATNILNALYAATDTFENPSVSAFAFEVAAACVKAGGKRFSRMLAEEETIEHIPQPFEEIQRKQPKQAPESKQVSEQRPSELKQGAEQKTKQADQGQAPSDWLKPKIFKSSNIS